MPRLHTFGEPTADAEHQTLEWVPLPARSMIDVHVQTAANRESVEASLQAQLARLSQDAIVRVHLQGQWNPAVQLALAAANLRALAPDTMNISLHEPHRNAGLQEKPFAGSVLDLHPHIHHIR